MPDTPKPTDAVPTDTLKDAGSKLVNLVVQRAVEAVNDRVTSLTDRLNDVAENGRSSEDDGDKRDDRGGIVSGLKDSVSGVVPGSRSGSGKKLKVTQIVEDHDIGLPLRTTYNLWTQFSDFPSFMKKVESVEQTSDEKSRWTAQVFLSHREWEATIIEQVPDSHIVWRSTGAKGHVDGAVTFTGLGPNLTRVLLVLEYYPQGLFERVGNIWRAQGRRARLEFQHFKRHAMTNVLIRQDEVEGWRGEIRDGEVVKTHEEALEEEGRAPGGGPAEDRADDEDDVEYVDEYDDEAVNDDAEYADDGYAADEPTDEQAEELADEQTEEPAKEPDDLADEDYEDEPDDEPDTEAEEPPRRGRRLHAASGTRGRR